MSVEEYQRISVDKFMGLYVRGLTDDCPQDHSPVAQNLKFNRKGETGTRDGMVQSVGTPANVKRMFVATFGHIGQAGIVLTCDGAGNIYRSDTGAVLLSVPNMVDFAAINIFSFCLISPILSVSSTSNPVYIWSGLQVSGGDSVPIRPAAGPGPNASFTAAESATAGDCDIGVHQFAVSFITNTGYTTQPGPLIAGVFTSVKVTSSGGFSIDLSNIPLGPTGTVARQILVTQADQELFFYAGGRILSGGSLISWDGVIHDNVTTAITISFFDTDLAVEADALFDLLPIIPGGTFNLIAGMTFYHNRVFFWGGEFNLVRVTNPGSAESVDNVNGYIQLPDQFDGNNVSCSCTLQDTLYFFKQVGIFSATDNGNDPNKWVIIIIDAGVGCTAALSLETINLTTSSLTQNQIALAADFGGLYLFTGAIIQPPLTWKINDFWQQLLNLNNLQGAMIAVDPFQKLIFVAVTGNAIGAPNWPNLLVADYNDGLDAMSIKWSLWSFPFPVNAIGMMFIQDASELAYRFRVASGNNIFKLAPTATTDVGTPIVTLWKSFYAAPDMGALNVFRYIRARMPFKDNIIIHLWSQDDAFLQTPPGFNLPYIPGRDLTREFNFSDEKCAVQFCCNAIHGGFQLQRLDIFAKPLFKMRPQV